MLPQTRPAYHLGHSTCLCSQTLACSHTVVHSPSLPFSLLSLSYINTWITTHSLTLAGWKAECMFAVAIECGAAKFISCTEHDCQRQQKGETEDE